MRPTLLAQVTRARARPSLLLIALSLRAVSGGDCSTLPPPPPLSPITHDITSPPGDAATPLLTQTLNPIPRNSTQLAATRRVPLQPHASMTATQLTWEADQTRAFLSMTLGRDPRLQPSDITVDTGHMSQCTSCIHDAGLHTSLHGQSQISIGNRTQLFVDDWLVHSWQNVARFLEAPRDKTRLSLDAHDDARYGCPCSAFETADGHVSLSYQSGPSLYGAPDDTWEEDHNGRYSYRTSADGVNSWSGELGRVTVNGKGDLGTVTVAGGSLPRTGGDEGTGYAFLGGYEGWRSRACFAGSSDGIHFNNIDNDHDRRQNGLNDDCLTAPGVNGANSALARAADTYIVPVVDHVREKEYIWYRKDFGTSFGWREVRGVQVVELDQRFADIPYSPTATGIATRHTEWYLDRLGKLERYRRHTYCVTLTPYSQDLWLGLMTVIEWPKDLHEPAGPSNPHFKRDTLNVYLVTSRDGVHIDHEWLYAHQPLLPKDGLTQSDYDGGLLFPAATFLTRDNEHRIYFEARAGVHHEQRYSGNHAVLGSASWARDRIAGVRAAHLETVGVITTKSFTLAGGSMRVEVDTRACGSSVRVEVRTANDEPIAGRTAADAVAISGELGSVDVTWAGGALIGQGPHAIPLHRVIRLRFELMGDAKLYAFQITTLTESEPPVPPSSPRPETPPSPPPPRCTDDLMYADAFGGCSGWADGTACRTGYAPVNTPEAIALLVASCPVTCVDVTAPECESPLPPPGPPAVSPPPPSPAPSPPPSASPPNLTSRPLPTPCTPLSPLPPPLPMVNSSPPLTPQTPPAVPVEQDQLSTSHLPDALEPMQDVTTVVAMSFLCGVCLSACVARVWMRTHRTARDQEDTNSAERAEQGAELYELNDAAKAARAAAGEDAGDLHELSDAAQAERGPGEGGGGEQVRVGAKKPGVGSRAPKVRYAAQALTDTTRISNDMDEK